MVAKLAGPLALAQLLFSITSMGLLAYIIKRFVEAKDFIDNFNPQAAVASLAAGKLPNIPDTFEVFGGFTKLGVTPAQLASGNLAQLLPLLGKLRSVLTELTSILKVLTGLGSTTLAANVLLVIAAPILALVAFKGAKAGAATTAAIFFYSFAQTFYFAIGLAFIAYTGVKSEKGTSIFYAFVAMWAIASVIGFVVLFLAVALANKRSRGTESNVEMREKETSI